MAGFIRRYGYFPGTEIITQIEGAIIVDLPPPGAVSGTGVGTTAVVGEFADMTYATAVDASGNVSTSTQPIEVFSSQDMINKVGGFDETLGDTGLAGGAGFITIRNKKFSRLICVPVNLASPKGVRVFRDLPTCTSTSNASPVVPVVAASVAAGREFKETTHRVRLAKRVQFTSLGAYLQSLTGAVTAAGAPAATQTFTDASAHFLTANGGVGVKRGDTIVVGVIGGALGVGTNADTYRVAADASLDTQLTVEKQDGSSFDWTTTAVIPYRLHPSTDADSGGAGAAATVGSYNLPARPLDATVLAATALAPVLLPPAGTATSWDPLSGLTLRTMPGGDLVYSANTQAPNAVNHADFDALYSGAIDALLVDALPSREVNILLVSRHSSTIRSKQKAHALSASGQGVGRVTVVSPGLDQKTTTAVIADADPGVGANRDERVFYAWPGAQTFVPEASGFSMKGADGVLYTTGILDAHLDGWLGSLLSVLPPERNPGQSSSPVPEVMSGILGFQRGVGALQMPDYITYRQKGIVALRDDSTAGFMFQSGITTSLTAGQKNIARRRMADFIQDSLAQRGVQYAKEPLTDGLKDSWVGEVDAFLAGLLSINNPPAQRISGYIVDDVSGNTPDMEAAGIFVVIAKVRTLASADFIVIQTEVGEGVNVTVA